MSLRLTSGESVINEYGCGTGCLGGDLGFAVDSIVCAPEDRCDPPSPFLGFANVGLAAASTTTVTFTNRATSG